MSVKKKHLSPCPFASAKKSSKRKRGSNSFNKDGSDVLLAVSDWGSCFEQEKLIALDKEDQNWWENKTVSASWAQIEGKGKDQPKVGQSNNCCRWSPARKSLEISFLLVLSRRCDSVGEYFCKIRAWFMLDRVLSKRGLPVKECVFLLALSPFQVGTSWSISACVCPSLVYAKAFPLSQHLSSWEGMWIQISLGF